MLVELARVGKANRLLKERNYVLEELCRLVVVNRIHQEGLFKSEATKQK